MMVFMLFNDDDDDDSKWDSYVMFLYNKKRSATSENRGEGGGGERMRAKGLKKKSTGCKTESKLSRFHQGGVLSLFFPTLTTYLLLLHPLSPLFFHHVKSFVICSRVQVGHGRRRW